ncbi:YsnF/AvaK domain-containing protein [Spirosoma utsteinense]|uniref:DUF2382 domain-containing protein n=1 Tax=Spirosoma utsteinense TaxID=2585773 RepID=A0ABR6W9Q5_9BACT|nr:YsnF/AvaK domain-containing protein [Spirosoma utsteinense]MBC3786760.1 putative protein (TIGR02271 family) [Spirosoma utsteinense]MBC3793297.1 putative protein (TIGR02271 family) [Spirosoma utsteinense]
MASLTVVGVFDNANEAQQAVEALVNDGFSRSNIDLSAQSGAYNSGDSDLVPDRHQNTSGTRTEEVVDDTKDVGSSIGNFFSSLFDSNDDADKYTRVADRSSIVTVHTQSEDEAERAADILDDNGAVDVDERAATYGSTTGSYDSTTAAYGTTGGVVGATGLSGDLTTSDAAYTSDSLTDRDRTDLVNNDQTIKVIEENLQVGKREVETGGVRVRSRIVERPVEESLRLREERVTIQRNPVNRAATSADLNAFQEGQIELVEHAEVPVVSKTANVVEEISIGKEVNERQETIRDTVRKTEVDVENLGTTDSTVRTERTDLDSDDTLFTNR